MEISRNEKLKLFIVISCHGPEIYAYTLYPQHCNVLFRSVCAMRVRVCLVV